jgi:hypothetical protein
MNAPRQVETSFLFGDDLHHFREREKQKTPNIGAKMIQRSKVHRIKVTPSCYLRMNLNSQKKNLLELRLWSLLPKDQYVPSEKP